MSRKWFESVLNKLGVVEKMFTRKQYMTNECTHREYYGQFVTDEIKEAVLRVFSREKLVHAFQNDESFNTLPLYKWDRMIMGGTFNDSSIGKSWKTKPFIPHDFSEFTKAMKEANGNSSISLSDCVCTCKEAARQIIEEIE
jgi:hypothetical protein